VRPARAAKPRDKAQVAVGVQGVERWMLARLRHHTFCARVDVHTAIAALLPALNTRPFKKLPGSRHSLFASLDRPALQPFPARPYTYAAWQLARVNIAYPLAVEGPDSSVPYALVTQQLEVRLRAPGVAIVPKGHRVASHQRSRLKGRHRTVAAPMPKAHRR
jgi:transposase